jgi:hypothetical protein
MTIQAIFNNTIKVSEQELENICSILLKSHHSLDQILEYDDGRRYQLWSKGDAKPIILDVTKTATDKSHLIITEITDCWLELRAVRNILESEVDNSLHSDIPKSPQEQLMSDIRQMETEIKSDNEFFQLMSKGLVDASILSYYNLDEEVRQNVLQ